MITCIPTSLRLLACVAFVLPPLGALSAPSATAQERMITSSAIVKASVADVYRTWTTTAGVTTFFAPAAIVDAKPGGLYEMHMNPFGAPGEKGADDMRILALQENRLLSFTWNAPPQLPEARKQRTVVIVRFDAANERETKVTLTHLGWGEGGEWDKAFQYFENAWPL